jgi:hypothetical protein
VIENVPKADDLRTVSLRLYFKAWAEIAAIVTEWEEYGQLMYSEETKDASEQELTTGWKEYIGRAQSDLQGIYTLIQQSQEIGIKALICEVSPYLLIKRTDVKASAGNTWEFTDFPTVDAAELTRIHNIFCARPFSKDFHTQYDEIRRSRNKIYHLGIYRESIDPRLIIDLLKTHYTQLYPGRRWVADRLHFATLHRWGDFDTGGDFNERTGLFNELWHLLPWISDNQYEWLMGQARDKQRYICHECVVDAGLGNNSEPYGHDVPTAYREGDRLQVRCVICDGVYGMRRGKCSNQKCDSELLCAEAGHGEACMVCGWTAEDWARELERRREQDGLRRRLDGEGGS